MATARIFVSWLGFYTERLRGRYSMHVLPGSASYSGSELRMEKSTRLMPAEITSYSVSGQVVDLLRSRNLIPSDSTYTTIGFDVPLRGAIGTIEVTYLSFVVPRSASRVILPEATTYSYSGVAAGLHRTRKLVTQVTGYSSFGRPLNTLLRRRLRAESTSITYTGLNTPLTHAHRVVGDPTSYAVSGEAINTLTTRVLTANPGTINLYGYGTSYLKYKIYYLYPEAATFATTGINVELDYNRVALGNTGEYETTGASLNLRHDRAIHPYPAAFDIDPIDVSLRHDRRLVVEPAEIVFTGYDTNMRVVVNIVPASRAGIDLIGQNVNTLYNRRLVIGASSYVHAGVATEYLKHRAQNAWPIMFGP